jgi:hypothetical protein
MHNHTCIIQIDKATLERYNAMLQEHTRVDTYGELINVWTANFGNGYEADIKIVNGESDCGPYVDPVLFLNGNEVCCMEVSDCLDGEYIFEAHNKTFKVIVKGI